MTELIILQSHYPELVARATETFGSIEKVAGWMTTPCRALQNQIPAEMLQSGKLEDVETELGRIEHGIYV